MDYVWCCDFRRDDFTGSGEYLAGSGEASPSQEGHLELAGFL
jgi:hypothetical protein